MDDADTTPPLTDLRVLTFCDYFDEGSSGGAERVAAEVAARLVERGAHVRILSATGGGPGGPSTLDVVPVPALDLSGLTGAQLSVSPAMWTAAARTARAFEPDVLHTHSLHFHCSLVAAVLARRRDLPLVTTVHVAGIDRLSGPVRFLTGAYEQTVSRFVLRSSAWVVAVSEPVADHAVHLGADPAKVTVVPNGVDHERFTLGPLPDDLRPLVVFIGRLIANKGPQVLLEATARLATRRRDFRVRFVGDGPLREQVAADVAARDLTDIVEVTGHSDDVAGVLADATIVVRPSFSEGMALTVLEGMASGRCVVASDLPANASIIRDGETGALFRTGDAGSLAALLDRLLGNRPLVVRLAEAGRSATLDLTWDRTAAGHASVLAAAAGAPARLG